MTIHFWRSVSIITKKIYKIKQTAKLCVKVTVKVELSYISLSKSWHKDIWCPYASYSVASREQDKSVNELRVVTVISSVRSIFKLIIN